LRIFVGEEDRYHGQLLYEEIVAKALEQGMAGATVLPGPEGFGRSKRLRTEANVDAGPRLPVAIEIVDTQEAIDNFLPVVHDIVQSGLVTLGTVRAIHYHREGPTKPDAIKPPHLPLDDVTEVRRLHKG
jgi:PII-like signaling protein